MLQISRIEFLSFLRPVHRFTAMAGLFLVLFSGLSAQRPNEKVVRPGMERLSEEQAALRLSAFRSQRLAGDYVFEFQLEHKPRRARTVRYDGIMWGSWNELGAITRVKIFEPRLKGADQNVAVELIIQNGPEARAWKRSGGEGQAFSEVEIDAIFEPILEGLVYSVFDLQMPFVFWPNFEYEGPKLFSGSRVAQTFLMYPPVSYLVDDSKLDSVRIALDDTYDALLQVEVLHESGNPLSRFKVESFKKVEERYIVNRITLTNFESRDRTSFVVKEASVEVLLDRGLFQPFEESLE